MGSSSVVKIRLISAANSGSFAAYEGSESEARM
jgi:hypothetical protein